MPFVRIGGPVYGGAVRGAITSYARGDRASPHLITSVTRPCTRNERRRAASYSPQRQPLSRPLIRQFSNVSCDLTLSLDIGKNATVDGVSVRQFISHHLHSPSQRRGRRQFFLHPYSLSLCVYLHAKEISPAVWYQFSFFFFSTRTE